MRCVNTAIHKKLMNRGPTIGMPNTMFLRKEFWDTSWSKINDFVFDHDFVKAFAFTEIEISSINSLVAEIIQKSSGDRTIKSLSEIRQDLDQTTTFALRTGRCLDEFVRLENLIVGLFEERELTKNLVGIQFPIDLRVVHSKPPPGYLDRKDAVDYLHCDGWRGEPNDGVNCLIYCDVGEESSHVQLYNVDREHISEMEMYKGKEEDAWPVVKKYPEVEFKHQAGQAIFFDSYSPHRTKRMGDKVRISLNFTFRRVDPYNIIDERWFRPRQNWSKYWYLPKEKARSFNDRLEIELETIDKKHDQVAKEKRLEYVQRLNVGENNVY